ncbi:uncharacterized protein AB675_5256 [Cyphellophora attinorum]|uniref:Transcription factor domain-containing protein n=1 Tax=Cyphellophora attinorum TaxID=1664694 RepID=A0A0N1NZS6_9EURO|nr:uncharacterized protein AB675_5256 [Phialophora attinorum]KPI39223.1 hypothetical protein AB675_5256 [Phialophora attinorum]
MSFRQIIDHIPGILKQWRPDDSDLQKAGLGSLSGRGDITIRGFVTENHKVEAHYRLQDPETFAGQKDTSQKQNSLDIAPNDVYSLLVAEVHTVVPQPVRHPEEAFLLVRYYSIIGPWFDLFDATHRHWTNTISCLALANRTLFAAILASCAKQYALVSGESFMSVALEYYDRGLNTLSQALSSPATAADASVFASCLLIGYCEMINARGWDWQTHLQGTYSLVQNHDWHGQCGGVAQSCFWVYCRMDLHASIARARRTLLDPSLWLPSGSSLGPDCSSITEWELDSWCNQTVVLLARAHNLLCDVRSADDQRLLSITSPASERESEMMGWWLDICKSVQAHEHVRPLPFTAVAELPPLDPNIPMRRIIHISPAACAASQMMDVARFYCLLARPDSTQAERKDRLSSPEVCGIALELARRVVSNSITNRYTTAWVNAVQLLSSVGRVLPGQGERAALLQALADIHRETGWSVQDLADDLQETWKLNDHASQQQKPRDTLTEQDAALRYVGVALLRCAGL